MDKRLCLYYQSFNSIYDFAHIRSNRAKTVFFAHLGLSVCKKIARSRLNCAKIFARLGEQCVIMDSFQGFSVYMGKFL